MGRKPLSASIAVLLAFWGAPGRAQDGAWEQFIESARLAAASKQFARAERLLKQARAQARGFAVDDPRRVVPLMELAKLHLNRGDYSRPEELYRQADPIARKTWGSQSPEYAALLHDIGRYYHLRVKYDSAENFYRMSCSIRIRLLGREHPDVASCLNDLAVLYENQAFYSKAETYYRTALQIREKNPGSDHVDTILTQEHLARLLHKLSRPDEAAEFEERSRTFREAQLPPSETVDLGVLPAGTISQPAVLLEQTEPDYTDEARIANQEGSVLLQADIDTDGYARNIRILRHLGLGLDEKAIEAVRQWRFRPARSNGRKAPSRVRLEIAFRLM